MTIVITAATVAAANRAARDARRAANDPRHRHPAVALATALKAEAEAARLERRFDDQVRGKRIDALAAKAADFLAWRGNHATA